MNSAEEIYSHSESLYCVLAGKGLVKAFSILAMSGFPKMKLLSNLGHFPVCCFI